MGVKRQRDFVTITTMSVTRLSAGDRCGELGILVD